MRLPFFGLVFGTSMFAVGVMTFSACSSSDPRPDAGSTNVTSSSGGSSGITTDGSSGGSSGTPGDAGEDVSEPPTCNNTIKDGAETDVDCGGNVCKKCFDGKACIANTDCLGGGPNNMGACLNNVCVTPKCNDLNVNGDETDVDCGGSICARCTIGKRCTTGKDCVSGACTTTGSCACPAGMTEVSKQGGNGAYCIDQTEVTKFQYNKFITANVNINDQIAVCKPPTNTIFVPRAAWPPVENGTANIQNPPAGFYLSFNYSLPVHYVDWCDAHAYCKWANKQLCGSVTGGAVAPDLADSADAGAWYNACSAQGVNQWPYSSNSFDSRCNGIYRDSDGGGPYPQFNGYGFAVNKDEGIHQLNNGDVNGNASQFLFAQCAGGVTGLYQMSGNVAEWEDSCDGASPTSKCRVRGGSFFANNDPTTLSCKGNRTEQRVPPDLGNADTDVLRDVGFRCCLY